MKQDGEAITNENNTFLSFKIAEEVFAFDISNVVEVLEQQSVTYVPKAPTHIKGVTNFRGNLLPVVDLGKKIGLEYKKKSHVVIVLEQEDHNKTYFMGALVDSVVGVQRIQQKDKHPFPEMKTSYSKEFVNGVYKLSEEYTVILDNKIVLG